MAEKHRTRTVLDMLGLPYSWLANVLRDRRIPLPPRDCCGEYEWRPEDIERLRAEAERCRQLRLRRAEKQTSRVG
jgi:hypothetical protein